MALDREKITSQSDGLDTMHAPEDWFAITFGVEFSTRPRAIESLTDGQVSIVSDDGSAVTVLLHAGVPKVCRPRQVNNPGSSTCTGLVGYK